MARISPSSDETPAIDAAETAIGHPHTLGVEYADDETLVPDGTGNDTSDYGEEPDIETHDYDEPHML